MEISDDLRSLFLYISTMLCIISFVLILVMSYFGFKRHKSELEEIVKKFMKVLLCVNAITLAVRIIYTTVVYVIIPLWNVESSIKSGDSITNALFQFFIINNNVVLYSSFLLLFFLAYFAYKERKTSEKFVVGSTVAIFYYIFFQLFSDQIVNAIGGLS